MVVPGSLVGGFGKWWEWGRRGIILVGWIGGWGLGLVLDSGVGGGGVVLGGDGGGGWVVGLKVGGYWGRGGSGKVVFG